MAKQSQHNSPDKLLEAGRSRQVFLVSSQEGLLARKIFYIVYDFFTRIGKKIPAWGGKDTHTEHFCNLFADKIAHQ